MATKKATTTSKKPTNKKSTTKKSSTNVTTVKAVSTANAPAKTSKPSIRSRFGLNRTPLVAALIAEFIGTFVFAATIIAGQGQPILVFFALVGVVLAVGTISGGYVNPALVLGAWITRRMKGFRAFMYIVAQVLGAMLALVVLNMYVNAAAPTASMELYGSSIELFKAAAIPADKEWLLFFSEFIGTLIFGFAVAGATREKKERTAAAFTVGLGLFLGLMIAGSATAYLGGSAILNPAVAVSLQALSFELWPIMVYVVGSSLGAIIGFILYDMLRGNERETA